MERNQELFEKIELYLKGGLSSIETENFELELKDNPDLHREVELHRFLETEIKDVDSIAFRQKLKGLALKKKKKKSPFRWAVAASIIILLGTSATFWFLSTEDNSSLFDKYYSVYPTEDVIRGSEKSRDEKKITNAYDNQKFDQVIPELKLLILKEPENELLRLYLGNAQLQTGQIKEAIVVFKVIDKKSVCYEDARWYLALSYLKLDLTNEVVPILKDIVKLNGRHHKSAKSLLAELINENESL